MTDKPKQTLKFVEEDVGFCRVYYRGSSDGILYCLQAEGAENIIFYKCSRDGEPEYSCFMPEPSRFDRHVVP